MRETAAGIAKKIGDMAGKINAENRDFTSEEKPVWDQLNKDYDALKGRIEIQARAESIATEQQAPVGQDLVGRVPGSAPVTSKGGDGVEALGGLDAARCLALAGWIAAPNHYLTEKQEAACRALHVNPRSKNLDVSLYGTQDLTRFQRQFRQGHPSTAHERLADFKATLSDQIGPTGAYLHAPETLRRELEINLLWYGGMRQVAETIRTETGERISWPTVDDTGNPGIQLAENTQVKGTVADPTFGKVFWDAYKYTSDVVLVPYELLQDSVFDLPRILGELLGIRLGRKTNTDFTNGTGASQPKGISFIVKQSSTFQKAAASSTAFVYDDIVKLEHSIDPAYRFQNPGFMLHDLQIQNVRLLKDGIGRPLWVSNIREGRPDSLDGYPLTVNNDMDSTVASTKVSMIFGALSHYKIRSVGMVRMYRLQERYRDSDQDGFLAFMREDGNLLTAGTPPLKGLYHT